MVLCGPSLLISSLIWLQFPGYHLPMPGLVTRLTPPQCFTIGPSEPERVPESTPMSFSVNRWKA
jgi:hypothetical protein